MHEYLISPKAYAISCKLDGKQLIAEMLYLKEEFTQETTHQNITLQIC